MVSLITSETPFPQPATLRVLFRKTGRMQYISHLDLVRTMTRVLIRAHIPVAYSEGFNPIPRLSFAAPLSVGVESLCEIMDIKVTHPVDCGKVMAVLNENLCPDLSAYDVYMSENKTRDIAFVTYTFGIHTLPGREADAKDVAAVLSSHPLTVIKASKTGEKETDISPLIRKVSAEKRDGILCADVVLAVENASFLNPDYLMRALLSRLPLFTGDHAHEYYTITRTGFYRADMTRFR